MRVVNIVATHPMAAQPDRPLSAKRHRLPPLPPPVAGLGVKQLAAISYSGKPGCPQLG